MTIIEFALLKLPPPTTSITPKLLANLVPVTSIIQKHSGLPTRFFSSRHDPHTMFVIGGWPSAEAHRDGFDGSEAQRGLWPLLDGMMGIQWMEYVDVEHGMLPAEMDGGGCLLVGVWRCGVVGEEVREQVERVVRKAWETERFVCAWNIKKGQQEREEDVLVGFLGLGQGVLEDWIEKMKSIEVEGVTSGTQVYPMERTVLPDQQT